MTYEIDLTGHRALVTGAGQGVGEEIARTLARAGAHVLVNDLVADRAEGVASSIRDSGASAESAPFDVTDYGAIAAAVETGDPVDILVNNAGNAGQASGVLSMELQKLVDTDPADWDRYMKVNLYGVMYSVRAVLPRMIDSGWGRIVTIISDTARVGETHMPAYSAAKAGAAGFCRSVAREVGRHNITCNCVALGTINTWGESENPEMLKRYVIRRRGLPSDIAGMTVFLASPQAEWITGQTYPVNGGYSFSL
jgi:3-oxoacyl-[acyl-carrier protein] reductase